MALFPPGPGGGQNVSYGYKGKGVLMHLLTEGSGLPLDFTCTGANGDERIQAKHLVSNIWKPSCEIYLSH